VHVEKKRPNWRLVLDDGRDFLVDPRTMLLADWHPGTSRRRANWAGRVWPVLACRASHPRGGRRRAT